MTPLSHNCEACSNDCTCPRCVRELHAFYTRLWRRRLAGRRLMLVRNRDGWLAIIPQWRQRETL